MNFRLFGFPLHQGKVRVETSFRNKQGKSACKRVLKVNARKSMYEVDSSVCDKLSVFTVRRNQILFY